VSCIYFVNEEYGGGDLVFSFLHTDKKLIIKPKKNNLIVWPSNFMYPHSVEPVTKGERYSVVAWGK
jgi:SM-20-related protein